MRRSAAQLREDALAIWHAGLDAVRSERLIAESVQVAGDVLRIVDDEIDLSAARRIAVVGAGKAGAGMAAALEQALGPRLLEEKQVAGWINVPADCVRTLSRIHLHPARPAGRNEPTEEGVAGTREILRIVSALRPDDLCLALISGGASALLPAPVPEITLADKLALTRHLSAAGANIRELNVVRKLLSQIKGGGLLRACRAGRLDTLIISDVIGDPLEIIGSGPTAPDDSPPAAALEVLARYDALAVAPRATDYLRQKAAADAGAARQEPRPPGYIPRYQNFVIGNNARAVDAAGSEAERRGYSHAMHCARELEGLAEDIGHHHARLALRMRSQGGPDCLITGGEPVVKLAPEGDRGLGGRNQQLVLAACEELAATDCAGVVLLSGATDGEDGPTDAAGAFIDAASWSAARRQGLDVADYLRRNDAYRFFAATDSLIRTGPTDTNVCDLRVVVVDRVQG